MGFGTKNGGFFFFLVLAQATLPSWHQHACGELGTWVRGSQGTGVLLGEGVHSHPILEEVIREDTAKDCLCATESRCPAPDPDLW